MRCKFGLFILSLVLFSGLPSKGADYGDLRKVAACSLNKAAFQNDMRKLWEDHVTWTRLYIVSAAAGLDDKNAIVDRLMRNQKEIGDAIKPFYGEAAGQKLTALLSDHVAVAGKIVGDLIQRDSAAAARDTATWEANADDIAGFLAGANANWKLADLKAAMHHHLEHTATEAKAHVNKDWAASVQAYDEVHGQILGMADTLSAGIIKQFTAKFCPVCPALSCSRCP